MKVEFEIVNSGVAGFEALSDFVDQLAACEDHPKGLLLDTEPV